MTNPLTAKHAPHALPLPAEWDEAITAYIATRRRARQPESSLNAYITTLQHLGRRAPVGPWDLLPEELADYADAQTWKPGTMRGRRQTIILFYRWAVSSGRCEASPVTEESMPVVKSEKPRPRPVPDAVYHASLGAADPRERLMLQLTAELGLRRAEVAVAHTDDILDDYSGGYSLLVHGKGAKDRVVPMPDSLSTRLAAHPRGFLFPGEDAGHLSPRWVGKLITDLLPEPWTMHTLRHRFGTQLFAATGNLIMVQEALGHESPETTRRYVDFDRRGMRAAIDELAARDTLRRAS